MLAETGDCRDRYPTYRELAADGGQAPVAVESGKAKRAQSAGRVTIACAPRSTRSRTQAAATTLGPPTSTNAPETAAPATYTPAASSAAPGARSSGACCTTTTPTTASNTPRCSPSLVCWWTAGWQMATALAHQLRRQCSLDQKKGEGLTPFPRRPRRGKLDPRAIKAHRYPHRDRMLARLAGTGPTHHVNERRERSNSPCSRLPTVHARRRGPAIAR